MTPEQVSLVQESWKEIIPISETAAELFYGKLFELDPDVKPLFTSDIKEQGRKLMQMIGIAVNGLTRLDEIVPAVEQLGERHVAYKVKDAHYNTVGTALLWTLNQGLGEKFTPAVEEAWALTYGTLAEVMKNAAAKVAA
jgi:hemoglobin-like flavoprotein